MEEKIYTGGNGWGNLFGAGFGGFLGAILGNNGLLGGGNGNAAAAAAQNTDMLSQQIQTLGQTVNANHASDLVLGGINSVNANIGDVNGNINDFARQMQDMCCQCKSAIQESGFQTQLGNERQTNTVQAGFSNIGYLIQQQGQQIQANSTANTQKILDWLCNSKQLEQATTIQQLRDEVGRLNQTANIIAALKPATTTAGA